MLSGTGYNVVGAYCPFPCPSRPSCAPPSISASARLASPSAPGFHACSHTVYTAQRADPLPLPAHAGMPKCKCRLVPCLTAVHHTLIPRCGRCIVQQGAFVDIEPRHFGIKGSRCAGVVDGQVPLRTTCSHKCTAGPWLVHIRVHHTGIKTCPAIRTKFIRQPKRSEI
ncbi:hypothetical protein BD309DRAFT_413334 [Dichomitus squalens]|nr:hypothetical protein BD309DRAFT_413334 [Dichomitus squalens]